MNLLKPSPNICGQKHEGGLHCPWEAKAERIYKSLLFSLVIIYLECPQQTGFLQKESPANSAMQSILRYSGCLKLRTMDSA
jgi:hypothetical protein